MNKLIVATDGSEGATRAIGAAARLAKQLGASLLIVHVNDGLNDAELEFGAKIENVGLAEMLDALSRQVLGKALEQARLAGAGAIQVESCSGDAAQQIVEIAQREHADAIVVGRRGLGRLSGILLGSVSQKIVSLAPCIVVVVP